MLLLFLTSHLLGPRDSLLAVLGQQLDSISKVFPSLNDFMTPRALAALRIDHQYPLGAFTPGEHHPGLSSEPKECSVILATIPKAENISQS